MKKKERNEIKWNNSTHEWGERDGWEMKRINEWHERNGWEIKWNERINKRNEIQQLKKKE